MLTSALALLLGEYRAHRMARLTAWVLAYGVALWAVNWMTKSSGGAPGLLWFLFWILSIVSGGYYFGRLVAFIRGRALWRLRRRLVVAYTFIAFVPILLIVLLVGLGAFIVNGQFGAFLVVLKLREHFDELQQVNRVVLHEARMTLEKSPDLMLQRIRKFYVSELVKHSGSYPGLEITLRVGPRVESFLLDGQPIKTDVNIPGWLTQHEFAGIVIDDGHLALRSVEQIDTAAGRLILVLSQPVTPELLNQVGEGVGPVAVVTTKAAGPGSAGQAGLRIETPEGAYVQGGTISSDVIKIPEPANILDFAVFGASSLDPILWGGERERQVPQPVFVIVTSRILALTSQLLSTLGEYSRLYVLLFKLIAIVFLVIEGIALVIGVRLTRSITRTVDKLYDATERVKTGDFSYRIGIPSHDQLSALGEAFDGMTASVERLLLESREKTRLQSELEIAREVQRQLFPQAAPEVKGLRLHGVCKAARSVSGDYYDFLRLGDGGVGLVLGDVSGKGISAALLMAAIQSALRAQFYDGVPFGDVSRNEQISTAQVVGRLNLQLHETTPLEKYVTFFFGIYNPQTRVLRYTNAGHLPPVLFRGDHIQRLGVGGTVVGLFSPLTYEEAETHLEPGDLLLAFTDGITEPENIYGEEFGEERVLEVARRALNAPPEVLVEEIYRTVNEWTGSPELQDDMTMVLAKAIE